MAIRFTPQGPQSYDEKKKKPAPPFPITKTPFVPKIPETKKPTVPYTIYGTTYQVSQEQYDLLHNVSPAGRLAAATMGALAREDIIEKSKRQQETEILNQPLGNLQATQAQLEQAALKEPTLHPLEAAGALGAAAIGAKGGALAGAALAPFTAGASIPVGAVLGGLGGFFGAITWEQRQKVREAYDTFTAAKGNMDWIKTQLKTKTMTTSNAKNLWDNSLLAFYASERNIKILNKDLNKFISGGSDEAATIQAYRNRLPDEIREFNLLLARAEAEGYT